MTEKTTRYQLNHDFILDTINGMTSSMAALTMGKYTTSFAQWRDRCIATIKGPRQSGHTTAAWKFVHGNAFAFYIGCNGLSQDLQALRTPCDAHDPWRPTVSDPQTELRALCDIPHLQQKYQSLLDPATRARVGCILNTVFIDNMIARFKAQLVDEYSQPRDTRTEYLTDDFYVVIDDYSNAVAREEQYVLTRLYRRLFDEFGHRVLVLQLN